MAALGRPYGDDRRLSSPAIHTSGLRNVLGLCPEERHQRNPQRSSGRLIFKPVVLGTELRNDRARNCRQDRKKPCYGRGRSTPVIGRYTRSTIAILADAANSGPDPSVLSAARSGGRMAVTGNTKPRSLMNFPAQSGGADMLRIARHRRYRGRHPGCRHPSTTPSGSSRHWRRSTTRSRRWVRSCRRPVSL